MTLYSIEPAKTSDSIELCTLASLAAMPGLVSIAMEREPDYFLAAGVQGEKTTVLVARSRADGKIAGVAAISRRWVYVNGIPSEIPYLSDLRILPQHRGGRLLAQAFAYVRKELLIGNDFAQTIVVEDNFQVLALLTSGRAGLPQYFPFGEYASPAIHMVKKQVRGMSVEIVRANSAHGPTLQAFYDHHARRRQFQPCYVFPDMGGRYGRDLKWQDYFLAYRNGKLVGMVGTWNQYNFKQTRVVSYGGAIRWLRPAMNIFAPLMGSFELPPAGSVLPYLNLHAIAIEDDNPKIFFELIQGVCNAFCNQGFSYLLCGLDVQDPLRNALNHFKKRHFGGRHYLVTFGKDPRSNLRAGPFYLEAARI